MPAERACLKCGAVLPTHVQGDLCPKCSFLAAVFEGADSTIAAPKGETEVPDSGDPVNIGCYKILQKIGEGGYGVVYMAEQEEPVRRRVALKVIKLGMDTEHVVARFEAERQALALMDHPNIARVFDAGATETGRPYFVMELVKGIPVTRYCDENILGTVTRLGLFTQICHAVQHAHQKGIIHRDIKPSNILVADHDGVPVPKIIDFGIAKATSDVRLTDKTLFTALEQFIGTPAYMSPEQAKLSGLDIDTRSDIYSLGVLLYELLTGKTPFDSKRFLEAGLDGIRRIIREEDPPRPSTRLSTLDRAEQTALAKRRRSEPPKLLGMIRGDLDWIVMKCLEKDRTRRYETANGLGLDIKRHLNSEPIEARPPSTYYRFQKLVRRHKVAVGAASFVAAALVVAFGVSSWSLLREKEARSRAQIAEKKAHAEADRANRNAVRESDQRRRAESNEAEARERLIRLSVANGNHLIEQGDNFGGLLWFVEAFRLDEDHVTREAIHRLRIGSVLADCPKLLQLWIHKGPISSVAFNPDGRHLVTTRRGGIASDASSDATAQIWEVNTGLPLGPPMVHTSAVESAVFSTDGRKLLTRCSGPWGGGYEQVQVWDAETANPITPPLQHTGWVHQAIFSPNGEQIAMWVVERGSRSNYVWLSKIATGKPVWAPIHIEGDPWYSWRENPLCFSPEGDTLLVRSLAASGTMSELRVLDTTKGTPVVPSWCVDLQVIGAAFSTDGKLVAAMSSNGIARVLRTNNGEPITPPLKHSLSDLQDVAFSPDSSLLATSGQFESGGHREYGSTIWDVSTSKAITKPLEGTVKFRADGYPVLMKLSSPQLGQEVLQLFDPFTGEKAGPAIEQRWGSGVVFDANGLNFAKSGGDGDVWLWELTSGVWPLMTLQDPPGYLSGSFSYNGEFVVTSASDGMVRVMRATNGHEASAVVMQRGGCTQASVSADGQWVVTFGPNGIAQIWNAATGQARTPPLRHKDPLVKYALLSPDGDRLATIAARPAVFGDDHWHLWDARTGKSLTDPLAPPRSTSFAVFSRDSKRILTARPEVSACVWDARTGRQICATGERAWPSGIVGNDEMGDFSADGRWIVTPGDTCQVWDAASGQPIGRPIKHTGGVDQAAFSPDSLRVATAGGDSAARIWDAASGEPVTAPMRHPARVHRVRFSPDGRLLATTCYDNNVRVWDSSSGESIIPPLKHLRYVYEIAFSADGSRLLTACFDGRIRIWEIPRDTRPIPDLALLAQLLAGRRIDQTSGLEILGNDALSRAWETLKARYPEEFKRTASEILARHEGQAEHCENVGLWSAAIWHLNHLIEAQPEEWKWRKWRGWLYTRSGEKEKAEADFTAAIKLGAPQVSLWWHVAQAWQKCGRLGEALSAMERSSQRGPHNSGFWVAKALMLEETNRLDEAYQAADRALLLAPSDDFVWRALVNMASRHASLAKAVELLEAAVRSDPTNVELGEFAALNKGTILQQTNRLQEAYETYSAALQLGGLSPRSVLTREQLLSRRSEVLKRLGRHAESISDFEKWLELSPLTAGGYNATAWDLVTGPLPNRDPERALLLAKKAVDLESTNVLYVDTLGVAYYRVGEWSKAAETFRDAIKLSVGNSSYPVEIDLLFLAMTYHQLGDPGKAKEYYERAVQEATRKVAAMYNPEERRSFRDEAEKLLGISAGAVKGRQ
jgi:WD40 repeat protein/serine/threonine protein kinase/tetratricopeptide (TPR) repeat protein